MYMLNENEYHFLINLIYYYMFTYDMMINIYKDKA